MKTKHRFPTKRQLEDGVDIACAGSGDGALEDLEATHVRLQLADGMTDDDEDVACIVVHLRVEGQRRWLFAGVFPFGVHTPWEEDDEILEDYLVRLVEGRGLGDEIDLDLLGDEEEEDEEDDEDDEDDEGCEEEEDDDSPVVCIDGAGEFREVVLGSDLPVLVDFTASWCGPCRALAPHLARLAEQQEGRLVVAEVDIDENEDLAEKWEVEAVPTLLLFEGGGKVAEMEGFCGPSDLKKFAARHLKKK